jgi:hypothetical protein
MNTIAPVHASSLDLLLLLRNLVQQTLAGDGGDKVVEYQQLHLTCQHSIALPSHKWTYLLLRVTSLGTHVGKDGDVLHLS